MSFDKRVHLWDHHYNQTRICLTVKHKKIEEDRDVIQGKGHGFNLQYYRKDREK